MPSIGQVAGVLLCRAGGQRLAFPAAQVAAVEAWAQGEPLPHAHHASGELPSRGRVLVSATGNGVVVEAIEVCQEVVPVLSSPVLLAREVGGSLQGFVSVRSELWPLLRLSEFSRFLAAEEERL